MIGFFFEIAEVNFDFSNKKRKFPQEIFNETNITNTEMPSYTLSLYTKNFASSS